MTKLADRALDELRDAVDKVQDGPELPEEVSRIVFAFSALDHLLMQRSTLPTDWTPT